MKAASIYKKFEANVSDWEKELDKYSEEDFIRKQDDTTWSIGQVYEHIISSTLNFHVKQIELCLSNNDNRNKGKNLIGHISLLIKDFPPVNIKIPPEENIEPVQPSDKMIIKERLKKLKDTFYHLASKIDSSKFNGKRSHPGFGYLLAKEWYELIEMHLRYHRKDKLKIDKYLFE